MRTRWSGAVGGVAQVERGTRHPAKSGPGGVRCQNETALHRERNRGQGGYGQAARDYFAAVKGRLFYRRKRRKRRVLSFTGKILGRKMWAHDRILLSSDLSRLGYSSFPSFPSVKTSFC